MGSGRIVSSHVSVAQNEHTVLLLKVQLPNFKMFLDG